MSGYRHGSGICVLTVPVSVDAAVVAELAESLRSTSDDDCTALVLDLDAALNVMSTAATSALCRVLRRAEQDGPPLALVCSHAPLAHTLRTVLPRVQVHPSIATALQHLR